MSRYQMLIVRNSNDGWDRKPYQVGCPSEEKMSFMAGKGNKHQKSFWLTNLWLALSVMENKYILKI